MARGISTDAEYSGLPIDAVRVSMSSPGSVNDDADSRRAPGSLGSTSGTGSAAVISSGVMVTSRAMPSTI